MKKYSIWKNALYVYIVANKFNKKYKYRLISSLFLKLLIPIFTTFIPTIVVYLIINKYEIRSFTLIVAALVIGYSIVNYISSYLSHILFFDKVFIRTNAFFGILSQKAMATGYQNIEFEENRDKLMKAVGAIELNAVGVELLLQMFPIFITSITGILLYSSYIMTINYTIVLVLLGMACMNVLLNAYARNYEKRTSSELNIYRTKLKYYQEESTKLVNAKDIRVYKLEKWFYKGIKLFTKKFSTTVMRQKLRYSLANLSDSVFSVLRNLIAYTILVAMVLDGTINVAEFTFMIGIVIGFAVWLNQLSSSYGRVKEASLRIDDFRYYMDLEDSVNLAKGEDVNHLLNQKLSIEFKNLTFTYPNASKPTIKNLTLKIEAGEKVALVGINGAGKTTLVKLLTGLYNPTEGEILINGTTTNSFNRYDYYKLFGVIFQDINILPFTIAQNVSGKVKEEIDLNKVHEALRNSGLSKKVMSLQEKEQTYLTQVIDDKGIMLSGGEMQKLMLARALYKDAPILVLDEPTAALDPLAEQSLYLKYNTLTESKTSLFISHRLASTQFCNRIVYLSDGTVLETGSHQELMKRKGKYFEMFEVQSQYYKENKREEIEDEKPNQLSK